MHHQPLHRGPDDDYRLAYLAPDPPRRLSRWPWSSPQTGPAGFLLLAPQVLPDVRVDGPQGAVLVLLQEGGQSGPADNLLDRASHRRGHRPHPGVVVGAA